MQRPADGKPPKRKAAKTLGKLQLKPYFYDSGDHTLCKNRITFTYRTTWL
jgi:hypothetical protein